MFNLPVNYLIDFDLFDRYLLDLRIEQNISFKKDICQKRDSNPRPQKWTAT
jgi:hypothetical protein